MEDSRAPGRAARAPFDEEAISMSTGEGDPLSVSIAIDPARAAGDLAEDVRRGLGSQPRSLPPKWL